MKSTVVVSLIGRPNVGKSSLFNRLMRKRGHKSLTHDFAGVTRDRHYGITTIKENPSLPAVEAILVDTGGFYPQKVEEVKTNDTFFNIMAEQAQLAISESDLVLFVVDAREGLLPFDEMIARYLSESNKEFWVIVNKFDTDKQEGDQYDFYPIAISDEKIYTVSAEHNRGLNQLRETIQKYCENNTNGQQQLQKSVRPFHEVVANIAIIGAPNVGKSTLLNQLTRSNRALVSNVAGTTVDPIEAYIDMDFGSQVKLIKNANFKRDNFGLMEDFLKHTKELDEVDESLLNLLENEAFSRQDGEGEDENEGEQKQSSIRSVKLVDTAGIRKQKLVKGVVETQSVYRSLRSITESDVVVLLVDAMKGITHHDRRLIDIALDKGKSVIVAINKSDLMKERMENQRAKKEWMDDLKATIPWLDFCQVIPISAQFARHLKSLLRAIKQTVIIRHKKISTSHLNRYLNYLFDKNPIMIDQSQGKRLKLKYASMLKASPPTFLLFTNKSQSIPDNFRRYLQNSVRKEFSLHNTPVHFIFRTTGDVKRRLKKDKRRQIEKEFHR